MIKAILFNTLGFGALKAIGGGLASAISVGVAVTGGACDLETIGQHIGSIVGAYVFGHVATWLPRNKPMKQLY